MNVILQAAPGSRKTTVYAAPTRDLLRLDEPRRSLTDSDGNVQWEVKPAVILALKGSPRMAALLWAGRYEVLEPDGAALVTLRTRLFSQGKVRASFLTNAAAQCHTLTCRRELMRNMDWRGNTDKAEADIRRRSRDLAESLLQGGMFWVTGNFPVRLHGLELDTLLEAEQDSRALARLLERTDKVMTGDSALPEMPDRQAAEDWLLTVRERNWNAGR